MTTNADVALHGLFDLQVRRAPQATAVRFDGTTITYAELQARTWQMAERLRAQGLESGSIVGLHMERSIDYVVALLAIFRVQGIALPLPTSYPPQRVTEIAEFAGLRAMIGQGLSIELRDDRSTKVRGSDGIAAHRDNPVESDRPAMILSTSGSTGAPKLIVRSHRSFYHRLHWTWEKYPFQPDDACCQKSFMTTTHALYELFEPLLRGVATTIYTDADVRDLERFWSLLKTDSVTRLLIVPSMLKASLDLPGFQPPAMKLIVLMGEHLPLNLARRIEQVFPQETDIYSIYGSTEASSTLVCDVRASLRTQDKLPLGWPISKDVHAYVIGESGAEAAPGESGVLHIAGPALFEGYLHAPQMTDAVLTRRESFSGPLYNTRDQVRVSDDGAFQFVGRVDHVVKVRGFRVDLDEVEDAIQAYPQVTQCAVVSQAAQSDDAALIAAFFTPATVDVRALRAYLAERLPGYMIPSRLIGSPSLPLTPSGKVDRTRLAREPLPVHAQEAKAVEDLSDPQRLVKSAFAEVLKHSDFDSKASFFEVGGTSLTAFLLVHKLRDAFRLPPDRLTERTIYSHSSVESLSDLIDRLSSGSDVAAVELDATLVTLRRGRNPSLPPLFVIASAGGTLGAYEKLTKRLQTDREIVGIRDPFIWGERDASAGFDHWVDLYLDAIVRRQPEGPVQILAYSSAGAFGIELVQRLGLAGREVSNLVLVDPLVLDSSSAGRFGYWAERAYFRGRKFKTLVRLLGKLMRPLVRRFALIAPTPNRAIGAISEPEFRAVAAQSKLNKSQISSLSALLQLNTGLPTEVSEQDLAKVPPSQYLDRMLARLRQVMPHVDDRTIENILVQYHCLQIPSHRKYRLRPMDCRVYVFEPEGSNAGLLSTLLGMYCRNTSGATLRVGVTERPESPYLSSLPLGLRMHYLCMRDDEFVTQLCRSIETVVNAQSNGQTRVATA